MKGNELARGTARPSFLSRNRALPHNIWLDSRDPSKGFGGWALYTTGFKRAADELVRHLGEESSAAHLPEFVAYPIAFLYRHYLELRLKQILWSTQAATIPKKHELMVLWRKVLERLKDFHPQDGYFSSDYERVTQLLRPFDELDPRSEGFRYPYDGDQLTISEDIKWMNLHSLREHVDEISSLLDKLWIS